MFFKAHFSIFTKHFYADLVYFCKCTGLRRAELTALKGNMITYDGDGYLCIDVTVGSKGGRPRLAKIIGDVDRIKEMMDKAGKNKVFDKIPNGADIHGYRSDYATALYNKFARPIDEIPYDKINKGTGKKYQSDVYVCRGEQKGMRLDKKAMMITSQSLGHSRISVVGEHYLKQQS